MTLFAFILGVLWGVALLAFIDAPVVKEPWTPPRWMMEHYYYRRNGRLFYIVTTPGRFDRLCERIEEEGA